MIDKSGLTFLAEQVAFSLLVSLLRSLPRKIKVRDMQLFSTFCTVCLNSHFESFRFLNPRILIYFLFFCFGALARMKICSSCAIAIGMTREDGLSVSQSHPNYMYFSLFASNLELQKAIIRNLYCLSHR